MNTIVSSLNTKNPMNDCILNANILEFDIKQAGLSAIKLIYGETSPEYIELCNLPKQEYTVKIGLMMRSRKGLSNKVDELMITWLNEFLNANNVKRNEFIENTRDSVLIWNKIPTKLVFKDFEMVNKEGSYSSFVRINSRYKILYDSLRNNIKLKGVNQDHVKNSVFVNKTLKNAVISLEKKINNGFKAAFSSILIDKYNYLNSTDKNVYREVLHENKYCYLNTLDNSVYYSDALIKDPRMELNKLSNYNEFLLPIIKLIL